MRKVFWQSCLIVKQAFRRIWRKSVRVYAVFGSNAHASVCADTTHKIASFLFYFIPEFLCHFIFFATIRVRKMLHNMFSLVVSCDDSQFYIFLAKKSFNFLPLLPPRLKCNSNLEMFNRLFYLIFYYFYIYPDPLPLSYTITACSIFHIYLFFA